MNVIFSTITSSVAAFMATLVVAVGASASSLYLGAGFSVPEIDPNSRFSNFEYFQEINYSPQIIAGYSPNRFFSTELAAVNLNDVDAYAASREDDYDYRTVGLNARLSFIGQKDSAFNVYGIFGVNTFDMVSDYAGLDVANAEISAPHYGLGLSGAVAPQWRIGMDLMQYRDTEPRLGLRLTKNFSL